MTVALVLRNVKAKKSLFALCESHSASEKGHHTITVSTAQSYSTAEVATQTDSVRFQ